MIRLIQKGTYQLREVSDRTQLLILDSKKKYALVNNDDIAYIPIRIVNPGSSGIKKIGVYRLYAVKNDAKLSNTFHLELFTYRGKCQGFLLPAGLPNGRKSLKKIFVTDEMISKIVR